MVEFVLSVRKGREHTLSAHRRCGVAGAIPVV